MARRSKSRSAASGRYVKSTANGKVAYRVAKSGFGVTRVEKKNKKKT